MQVDIRMASRREVEGPNVNAGDRGQFDSSIISKKC